MALVKIFLDFFQQGEVEMKFNQAEFAHLKAQVAKALDIIADHEKRLLLQEGKYSHATEMKKAGKKAVGD